MKRILLVLFIIGYIFGIYSKDITIKEVAMDTIFEIPYGNSSNEFGKKEIWEGSSENFIRDIAIMGDSYITIDVYNNWRPIKFNASNKKFDILKIEGYPSGLIEVYGDLILFPSGSGTPLIYNTIKNKVVFDMSNVMTWEKIRNLNIIGYGFTLFENMLISETSNDDFVVVDLNIKEREKYKVIIGKEALKLLKEQKNIVIKDDKYLFYKGQFYTKDPLKFKDYMKKYGNEFKDTETDLSETSYGQRAIFSGIDKDNNYYWSSGAACYIFNDKGKFIKRVIIDFKEAQKSDMIRFVIDNDGNLYRFISGENSYYLKTIKRFW